MEPILVVLVFATLAAFTAPLGVLPLRSRTAVPPACLGWANALAAGFMLGAAYVIAETALVDHPVRAAAGAFRRARSPACGDRLRRLRDRLLLRGECRLGRVECYFAGGHLLVRRVGLGLLLRDVGSRSYKLTADCFGLRAGRGDVAIGMGVLQWV